MKLIYVHMYANFSYAISNAFGISRKNGCFPFFLYFHMHLDVAMKGISKSRFPSFAHPKACGNIEIPCARGYGKW